MPATNGTAEIFPAFWTILQVAKRLSVSARTVRRWVDSGDLVGHRFGGQWRIADADRDVFERLHRQSKVCP